MSKALKIINIVVIIAVLVAAYVVYEMEYGGGAVHKLFVKPYVETAVDIKTQDAQELRKLFPNRISEYELVKSENPTPEIESECRKAETEPDLEPHLKLSGEYCIKNIRMEYREKGGNRVVFVTFMTVEKGKDIFTSIIEKVGEPSTVDDFVVYRIENHEIGWIPESRFDFIMTQQGTFSGPDPNIGYFYTKLADSKNPVFQYFLDTFPSHKIDPESIAPAGK